MNDAIKFVLAVAAPVAVGGLSGYATAQGVSTWYPTLVKPPFNPPAWVFGPVWTVLYVMMGVAAFLVWRKGLATDGVRIALTAFAIQLALNGLWSILFWSLPSHAGLSSIAEAVYLSLVTFTTLGYGDITLAPDWQLLGPLEAMAGGAVIGLTTALLFAVIQRSWQVSHERAS